MTDIPTSVRSGSFSLGGVTLTFHVLSDGQRVIEHQSMMDFLEALHGDAKVSDADALSLAKFILGREEQ